MFVLEPALPVPNFKKGVVVRESFGLLSNRYISTACRLGERGSMVYLSFNGATMRGPMIGVKYE